jgi:uncharacterized membrane protein
VAESVKMSMKRNLNVYIEEKSSLEVELTFRIFFSKAESGIERSTKNIMVMMVIVPQKKDMSIASFLRTS